MGAPAPPAAPALVHVGREGWLFLQGGANFVTSLYARESGNLPDRKLALWARLIEKRARRCAELGIRCAHVVVPDKLTIYGEFQAEPLVDPRLSPAVRLAEMMAQSSEGAAYLDLVAPMLRDRAQADLYWRTDTHWSPEGCFLTYRALCDRLGLATANGMLERPFRDYDAIMDLGGRLSPPLWEKVRKYDYARDSQRVWVNRVTRYLEDPAFMEEIHVGARARFSNPSAANVQNMMLVGDSHCNPSASGLTAMLAETMRSLEFIWWGAIDWAHVKSRRPDILVFVIAERFLAAPPRDGGALWALELRQAVTAHLRRFARWLAKRKTPAADSSA